MPRIAATLALLTLLQATSRAETMPIFASADTTLFQLNPDDNWGAETELVAGTLRTGEKARILLEFDIAAHIPAGSTITAAQLTLRVVKTPPGPQNTNFHLLRVQRDWAEGATSSPNDPGGDTAQPGETTWNALLHPATGWTRPGGQLEVDYAEDPSATQFIASNGNKIFDFNANGINDLQSMLDVPANNHGWVLVTEIETASKSARRWAAREHPTNPPRLVVTFTPPPAPQIPDILSAQLDPASGVLDVDIQALAGTTYTLETRPDLASGDWADSDSKSATTAGPLSLSTILPSTAKRWFFRVTARLTP